MTQRGAYRAITLAITENDSAGRPREKQSVFEVHKGPPGKPRVYRRRAGSLRRVKDEATLRMVADALVRSVRASQATDARLAKRQGKWWYRLLAWLYGLKARAANALADAVGPDWRAWFR